MNWHLAQVNIAVCKYAYEDSRFSGFVDNLDRINAIADAAPGFVWRYLNVDGDDEVANVFGEQDLIFNMSVWQSKDSLLDYVYKTDHVDILRRRANWFVPQKRPILALWWVPEGTIPTVADARQRLEQLAKSGPSVEAFTFSRFFEPRGDKEVAHG